MTATAMRGLLALVATPLRLCFVRRHAHPQVKRQASFANTGAGHAPRPWRSAANERSRGRRRILVSMTLDEFWQHIASTEAPEPYLHARQLVERLSSLPLT